MYGHDVLPDCSRPACWRRGTTLDDDGALVCALHALDDLRTAAAAS